MEKIAFYRMTYRFCGNWHDKKEEGETFDFDTEEEAISLLNSIGWTNWRGEKLNYRAVTEKQYEEECRSYAVNCTGCEMGYEDEYRGKIW